MGPLLLFDKSLLHALIPEEVEELRRSFLLVGTPTLTREILADLKKQQDGSKLPHEMVRALARKMGESDTAHAANFRKLALYNLDCVRVPMRGQVPIDGDAPNVRIVDGGRGMIYDKTPEQRIWRRWADGDFSTKDHEIAGFWRSSIERVNLKAVGDSWKEYVQEHFAAAKTMTELVAAVDHLLQTPRPDIQRALFFTLTDFLRAPEARHLPAVTFLKHGCLLESVAPYAASILRLYLTFVASIAKGFIGPRPSHYTDLQYLFYAPFCMVFVSGDKLHEKLWPAASGEHVLVTAAELKHDLAHRISLRKQGVQTFSRGYPIYLENSVITKAMDHAFRPGWRQRLSPEGGTGTIEKGTLVEDLPKIDRDRIKAAFSTVDAMPGDEPNLA